MKKISWNVNGIRAIQRKGFIDWFKKVKPDILCLQETKANINQLDEELKKVNGYNSYWNSSTIKKGYSGVVTYTNLEPTKVSKSIENPEFDKEGRIVITYYKNFILFNVYFPNGQVKKGDKEGKNKDWEKRIERLNYKLRFYEYFINYIEDLRKQGKSLIICGDYNTAHKEIDLARPKDNKENTGFLIEERELLDKLVEKGYIDTFRKFNKEPDNYTWWSYRGGARKRNVGWRIDYCFITPDLEQNLKSAFILNEVMGSDHCPIGIEIDI
ncbi:MAG: exodeoxyribonuclease III [Spirochaetota bacterium]